MKLKKIKPKKGECYHNCYRFMIKNPTWTLVHGIPTGTGGEAEGQRYGHAWVEKEENGFTYVYDPSSDTLLPAHWYYAIGKIEYSQRYSYQDMIEMVIEFGHSGAWDEKIAEASHKEAA